MSSWFSSPTWSSKVGEERRIRFLEGEGESEAGLSYGDILCWKERRTGLVNATRMGHVRV